MVVGVSVGRIGGIGVAVGCEEKPEPCGFVVIVVIAVTSGTVGGIGVAVICCESEPIKEIYKIFQPISIRLFLLFYHFHKISSFLYF